MMLLGYFDNVQGEPTGAAEVGCGRQACCDHCSAGEVAHPEHHHDRHHHCHHHHRICYHPHCICFSRHQSPALEVAQCTSSKKLEKNNMQTTFKLLTFDLVNNIVLVNWSIGKSVNWSIGLVEKVAKRPEKKRCKAEEKVDLPGRGDVKDFIVL